MEKAKKQKYEQKKVEEIKSEEWAQKVAGKARMVEDTTKGNT